MRIGIDARLYSQTGVGRYIRNLINYLAVEDQQNQYVIFLTNNDFKNFELPNDRWQKIRTNIQWHSFTEQWLMPWILYRHRLDLVHFPYFNIPLLYWKPYVVTLHDLTIWKQETGKASTRPLWYYFIKKLGYHLELYFIARKAKMIIAISQAVSLEIQKILQVPNSRIKVIYEGIDQNLLTTVTRKVAAKPYLLTVGNFYPHKNLTRLIFAFRKVVAQIKEDNLKLILVGPKDFFYYKTKKFLKEQNLLGRVQFILHPPDLILANLYRQAEGLIFPSLAEGFGLPGLEAISLQCLLACSRLKVFEEIYGPCPIYFNELDVDDMASKILFLLKESNQSKNKRRKLSWEWSKRYSWKKCARETLETYENCLSLRSVK
jgi:glycosyltransferase involved in cell wall biosynthesis